MNAEADVAAAKAKVRALLGSPGEPVQAFTIPTRVDAHGYYHLKSKSLQDVKTDRSCGEGETTMQEQKEIHEAKQRFLKLPSRRNGNQMIVNVTYQPPKDGFPGRLWSPLNSLWGPYRSLLLKDTIEADMACCMQVCIRQACWAFDIACPHLDEYTRTKEDRERVLQTYMDAHGGCTRGAAKDAYQTALTNMHPIRKAKGAYKEFDAEAKRIQKELMAVPELQWIKTFCKDGKGGVPGSFISHVFNFIECKCLLAVRELLATRFGPDAVAALVYDGASVRLDANQQTDSLLEEMRAACNAIFPNINMRWEFKPIDLTIKTKKTRKVIGEIRIPDSFALPPERRRDGGGGDGGDGGGEGGEVALDPETEPTYEELWAEFSLGQGENPAMGRGKVGSNFIDLTKEAGKLTLMDERRFRTEYKHMSYYELVTEEDKDGNEKLVKKEFPFIDKWLRDKRMDALYLVNKSKRYYWKYFGMHPKQELCPPDCYNLWTGFAAEAMDQINPADEVIQKGVLWFLEHFKMLTDGNKAQYDFLLDMLAHTFQYPDHKLGIMLCLVGMMGAGKTTVWNLIQRMIGKRGCFGSSKPEKDVYGDNNPQMAECFFCRIVEANKNKMKDHIGEINTIVTDGQIRIRSLFCAPENVDNYTRFFLDTDRFDAIPDEHGQRRYFIIMCSSAKIGDTDYWNELSAAIADDKIVRAFYDFLMAREGVKPHYFGKDIPVGKYQKDLKDANRSEIDKFVMNVVERELLTTNGWISKTNRQLGHIAKDLGMGDGDEKKEASTLQSIITKLGIHQFEGVKKGHDTSSGKPERVWFFNLDVLRKRYGFDVLVQEATERAALKKQYQLDLARYDKEYDQYKEKAREHDGLIAIGYSGDQAPAPPTPPVRPTPPEELPPRPDGADPSRQAPPEIDCEKEVTDWAARTLARMDGTAATGDLSNKNEAFVKGVNMRFNQWVVGQYTIGATTGETVSIAPDQAKEKMAEITRALEREWADAGISWAPAIGAAGASSDPPAHPASPTDEHAMDVEQLGGGGSSLGGGDAMEGAAAPPPNAEWKAAFVLPVRTSVTPPMVLLTRETRGHEEKLGLLGGKKKAEDRDEPLRTAAREAWEETNEKLSLATRRSIEAGDRMRGDFAWVDRCKAYVFVHELEGDADAHLDRAGKAKQTPGSSTEQLGVQWVSVPDLMDRGWRDRHMYVHTSMIVAKAYAVLCNLAARPHAPAGDVDAAMQEASPVDGGAADHGEKASGVEVQGAEAEGAEAEVGGSSGSTMQAVEDESEGEEMFDPRTILRSGVEEGEVGEENEEEEEEGEDGEEEGEDGEEEEEGDDEEEEEEDEHELEDMEKGEAELAEEEANADRELAEEEAANAHPDDDNSEEEEEEEEEEEADSDDDAFIDDSDDSSDDGSDDGSDGSSDENGSEGEEGGESVDEDIEELQAQAAALGSGRRKCRRLQ